MSFFYGKLRRTGFLPVMEDEVLERGILSETADDDGYVVESTWGMTQAGSIFDRLDDTEVGAQAGMADFGDFTEMTDTGAASSGRVYAPVVPVECFDADLN